MSSQSIPADAELDDDRLLDTVSNDRRRRALSILKTTGGQASIPELAAALARRERRQTSLQSGGSVPAGCSHPDEDHVDQLKIVLHHRHVPKLADAGLVEYESDDKTVRLATTVQEMERATELLRQLNSSDGSGES